MALRTRWFRPKPQIAREGGFTGAASEEFWAEAFSTIRRYDHFTTTLYHYTTLQGLVGIVTSREVWLSNSRFMNDASELAYGREQLSDICDALENRRSPGARFKELLGSLRNAVSAETTDAFIFCLCEEPDLLGQWRGYADQGAGVAIGFNIQRLVEALHPVEVAIEPAAYGSWKQEPLLKTFVKTYRKHLNKVARRDKSAIEAIIRQAHRDLGWLLPFLKSEAFEEEQEWRLMHLVSKGVPKDSSVPLVHHRVVNGLIVPYIRLTMHGRLPISKIMIGPSPHKEAVRDGVADMLARAGHSEVLIEFSKTPFRAR